MKKLIQKAALFTLIIAFIMPVNVFAAGKTTIDITNKAPKAGDTFKVKISASEKGKMTLSYNAEVIEFVGSDVSAIATSSHSIEFTGKNVEVTFKAKKEGSSGVIIESPSLTGSSITVPVSKGAEEAVEQKPQSEETDTTTVGETETEGTEVESNISAINTDAADGADFVIDGVGYVVSEKYKKDSIPEGFSTTELEINGKSYKELTNGIMTLVYLKTKDDTSGAGEFYILDAENATVLPLVLLGDNKNYVICTDDGDLFSESLTESYFSLGDKEYKAYQIKDAQSEFFYVYGVNNQGAQGWYAFDSITNQVSRADTMSLSLIGNADAPESAPVPVEEPAQNESGFTLSPKILMVAGIVFIVLLIILIIANIVLKHKEDEYEFFDEDEDEVLPKTNVSYEKTNIENTEPVQTPVIETPPVTAPPKTESVNDELIDELIKKASENSAIEIMDLDDM